MENLVVVQGTWLTGLILMLLLSVLCSRKSEDVPSRKFILKDFVSGKTLLNFPLMAAICDSDIGGQRLRMIELGKLFVRLGLIGICVGMQ